MYVCMYVCMYVYDANIVTELFYSLNNDDLAEAIMYVCMYVCTYCIYLVSVRVLCMYSLLKCCHHRAGQWNQYCGGDLARFHFGPTTGASSGSRGRGQNIYCLSRSQLEPHFLFSQSY